MEKNWDKCIKFVLKEEGGYSNDPDDAGGATNHGVTLGEMIQIHKSKSINLDLDKDGDVDKDDVKLVTVEIASKIFHIDYWLKAKCNEFKSGLDLMKFDCAVNCGVGTSGIFMSKIFKEDLHGMAALKKYRDLREEYYRKVATKRNNQKFLKGWLGRLGRCMTLAETMYKEEYGEI